MHVHPPVYVCIINDNNKRQIPWRKSRGLNWENKTYKVKRCINESKLDDSIKKWALYIPGYEITRRNSQ